MARGGLTATQEAGARQGLGSSLDVGAVVLEAGGSALDAVEAAVRVLEDDPHFNAGRGAAFTFDGTISLDAAIMDGAARAAGAVAGVSATRNPVRLARAVMDLSPHVLLSGTGADEFSREQGLEQADMGWFSTRERLQNLQELKAGKLDGFDIDLKYGTVGAVAMDTQGRVAAATSTGGLTGKRWGRIGDSPLIGAGTYADNRSCAISANGAGEYFMRECVAHEIGARVRLCRCSPAVAAQAVLAELAEFGGVGGVILAAPGGSVDWIFTTPGLYRGRVTSQGDRTVSIFGDEP